MESGGQVEDQVRSIGGARRYLNSRSPCRRFISGSSSSARLKIGPLAGGTLLLFRVLRVPIVLAYWSRDVGMLRGMLVPAPPHNSVRAEIARPDTRYCQSS